MCHIARFTCQCVGAGPRAGGWEALPRKSRGFVFLSRVRRKSVRQWTCVYVCSHLLAHRLGRFAGCRGVGDGRACSAEAERLADRRDSEPWTIRQLGRK